MRLLRKIIPGFIFSLYHYLLAFIGALFYGFPSRRLVVIGVTGTNGKSTVVHLATEVLEKSGFKVASISSVRFKIGKQEWPNMLKMTMPGRLMLQRFLKRAVKAGCKYVVLEVTSEGIKQHRHRFISFNGAVFTNLSREHIEAHKGFENYKKAKGKLFKALQKSKKQDKFSVINIDDPNADYFLKLSKGTKIYTYGINNKKADITPDKINLQISLPGEFNVYNSLAVVGVALSQGIDLNKTLEILKRVKGVPGRMELVIDGPFKVFVDYAHTPDSLEKVYKTLQDTRNLPRRQAGKTPRPRQAKQGRQDTKLICVLGSCGGGRDKWKRPEMGKIAAKYCDKIILTNEDPYDENPSQILSEIKSGISNFQFPISNLFEILDRREAIRRALSLARKNDVVIITGKGCEPWMCIERGKKIPWDDRRVAREEFSKLSKG